jgi:hypothetical protein
MTKKDIVMKNLWIVLSKEKSCFSWLHMFSKDILQGDLLMYEALQFNNQLLEICFATIIAELSYFNKMILEICFATIIAELSYFNKMIIGLLYLTNFLRLYFANGFL